MVWGISVMRDETELIPKTVAHMQTQVDRVLVFDNQSVDGTGDMLRSMGVYVVDDPEPGHYQSRKTSQLAEMARERGATWVVPFDADEWWTGRQRTIKRTLEGLPGWVLVAEANLYDHVASSADNGGLPRYRRKIPLPLPKVAVRAKAGVRIHEGNHGASFPADNKPPIIKHLLTVRHFPYRSAEQMIEKARRGALALAATDLPEDVGAHWRGYGRLTDAQLREVFAEHFYSDDPANDPELVEDPV